MFIVCVNTIDKFSNTLEGEKNPKNIEEQFKKYCLSTKIDKEKRLVSSYVAIQIKYVSFFI